MILGKSRKLSTRLHLAAGGNRCSPPGQPRSKAGCEGLGNADRGSGWGFSPGADVRIQDRSTITQTKHTHVRRDGKQEPIRPAPSLPDIHWGQQKCGVVEFGLWSGLRLIGVLMILPVAGCETVS